MHTLTTSTYIPESAPNVPTSRRRGASRTALAVGLAALTLSAGCDIWLGPSQGDPCLGSTCTPTIDETAPEAPLFLFALGLTRQSLVVEWGAPIDPGGRVVAYELVASEEPIDEAGFDRAVVRLTVTDNSPPGSRLQSHIEHLRPGTPYYVAVVAIDGAGNRSPITTASDAVVPDFSTSDVITSPAPEDGDNALGYQTAFGRFNGDEYDDVAVAAPFKHVGAVDGAGAVFVYLGGPDGIASTPSVTLEGTGEFAQFGNALAALDWNGDGLDDLAVGAPFSNAVDGAVYIFHGGDAFSEGATLRDTEASFVIDVAPTASWLRGGGLGWTMTAGRFDGDARDDLAITSVAGGAGNGGLVIVYGDDFDSPSLSLSDTDGASMNGVAHLLVDPRGIDPADGGPDLFGHTLVNLGPTAGGETDDLGIAYFDGDTVLVVRGRVDRPTTPGLYDLALSDEFDLIVRGSSARFGAALGSVAADEGRDVVIGTDADGDGQVFLVAGSHTGDRAVGDIAHATISGAANGRFGTAVVNNAVALDADIDGDRREDLVIIGASLDADGQPAGVALHIWFSGELPEGAVTSDSAGYTMTGPALLTVEPPIIGGSPLTVSWVGDLNGDGLDDLLWADWAGNVRDGAFEIVQ